MINKFLQLIVVSFVTAIIYYLLISFDMSQNETPIRFSILENFIYIPLMFVVMFIPYVFFYGLISFILKFFIEKIVGLKNVFFDIIFYVSVSIIVIPILPRMLKEAANNTAYQFFINPYYLIPFVGGIILIIFEVNSKKEIIPSQHQTH